MGEREIIIADGDTRYRSQVTDFFRKGGYSVGTADSVEQVLASVQAGQPQVLLLGSSFSTKISASDLIHLLKKCSRQLHIILVSDGMTLGQTRQVRQEGVFYLALKPATAGDTDELGQAVACAFDRRLASSPPDPAPYLQGQPAGLKSAEKPGTRAPAQKPLARSGTAALFVSASYYLLAAAAEKAYNGEGLTVGILLCFGALLVAGQGLPIFRIRPAQGRAAVCHAGE